MSTAACGSAAPSADRCADRLSGFGGFLLGAMALALPISALREVVPCSRLVALPCPAACVVGGIVVRGVTVPVVDLRIVWGQHQPRAVAEGQAPCFPTVVIMTHGGRLLGLLADAVTGVFEAQPGSWTRTRVADPIAAVFEASVNRADTQAPVSVLSPEALAALHQVPMVDDATAAAPDTAPSAREPRLPVMLLRSGELALAIDALVVRTTLSCPQVDDSVLTRGHCRGTIAHDGMRIPALDLASVCGFAGLAPGGRVQALIVSLPAGSVALLVGEVVDIVATTASQVARVPAFALPEPQLFAGALPLSALPDLPVRAMTEAGQYLLIDGAALMGCEAVRSMAQANSSTEAEARVVRHTATAAATSATRPLITYLLRAEMASPLEQVCEILPLPAETSMTRARGQLLGLMVNRGRSIPVVCLGQALGHTADDMRELRSPRSRVLLVESHSGLVGFAVSELRSIEEAAWALALPCPTTPENDATCRSKTLACIGEGPAARTLPQIDLQALAASYLSQPMAA